MDRDSILRSITQQVVTVETRLVNIVAWISGLTSAQWYVRSLLGAGPDYVWALGFAASAAALVLALIQRRVTKSVTADVAQLLAPVSFEALKETQLRLYELPAHSRSFRKLALSIR